jgi:lysozyme
MTGIDVSTYQGDIDWAAVKASGKAGFAYAKATEGTAFTDDRFAHNYATMKLRNVPRGAYHFFRFAADPVAQADHFLNAVPLERGDLLPMVDVEVSDGVSDIGAMVQSLAAFLQRVEGRLGGKRMVIYTGYAFWGAAMGGSDAFSGHPLWIAEYNDGAAPALPNGWNAWAIWQYSDAGSIPGIGGNVDMDRLNGEDLSPYLF